MRINKGECWVENKKELHGVSCKKYGCVAAAKWYQYSDDPDRPCAGWEEIDGFWYCKKHAKETTHANHS